MPTTTTKPVPDDISARPRNRAVRRATTATLFAVALTTAAPAAVDAARGGADLIQKPVGCIVTRTADSMGFDVTALMTTVRSYHGAIQVLHDVICLDGHSGTVWITADLT